MQFTDEQQQAIYDDHAELLVSAAAGSGKTAVLVNRILRLITQRGMSVERMLVVTFTRAAAGELRERLERLLNDAAQQDARLREQAELVASAQISTIHGYCQQVVREHFQFCEVDPQFTICETATRARLFDECLQAALDELYTLAKQDDDLAALTAKYTERELADMLPPLYDFLLSRPDPMQWLKHSAGQAWSADDFDKHPLAQMLLKEAGVSLDATEALLAEARELIDRTDFPDAYIATLNSDQQTLAALRQDYDNGFSSFYNSLVRLKFVTLARAKAQTDAQAELMECIKDYRDRYKSQLGDLKKLLPATLEDALDDMRAMRSATVGLYKLVRLLHDGFTQRKRDEAVVDFADLEHMALAVLKDERLSEVEKQRFDAVFVDEYQDVSAIQEALLRGLRRKGDDDQLFFYVGDVKQSIYRFRLAEPTLFLSKQSAFRDRPAPQERLIVLNRNFRSRSTVLRSVNRVFEHLMDSRVTEIDYDEQARLVPGAESSGDPPAELHLLDNDGLTVPQRVLAEATFITKDILAHVGDPVFDAEGNVTGTLKYRDHVILLPVVKNVADKVELVLKSMGVPVYCENASDSMQSDEITQVVQHLKLMDNLMDDLSLISELRSPLFEMSESELCQIRLFTPQKEASFLMALRRAADDAPDGMLRSRCAEALSLLERERFLLNNMALDEYLWDFLQRSGLYAHYGAQPGGKQRLANLQMLCNLASDHEHNRADGLRGFLDSLSTNLQVASGLSPTVVNPWEDVVRIMTIHKSKGLEFPTVYLMGLGGALRRRSQSGRLSYHGDLGVALCYVNQHSRTRRKTLMQIGIDLKRRAEELAENTRKLYVAMTRAKSRIVMLGSKPIKELGFTQLINMQQSDFYGAGYAKRRAYLVRGAGSMLDWLVQCVRPWDDLEELDFSTNPRGKRDNSTQKYTHSTGFPQVDCVWRVVFHISPAIATVSQKRSKVKLDILELPAQMPEKPLLLADAASMDLRDPIAPDIPREHHALKLGVTALCRMADALTPDEDEETPVTKRQPYEPQRAQLLDAVPSAPAFLLPPEKLKPTARGSATHKLISLIDLDAVRAVDVAGLDALLAREVERLLASGRLTSAEAAMADTFVIAAFLKGDMGRRMLDSDTVRREWRFNLRVTQPMEVLAQGVIDLCFLEGEPQSPADRSWVLLDFKTDHGVDAHTLYTRYHQQLQYYRMALERATPYPVKCCALYSLALGHMVDESAED